MNIGELCNREVMIIERDERVLAAAQLMREYGVGDVVIVEARGGKRFPVGIVTDRDLAVHIIADEVDPRSVSIGDLFIAPQLVTASVSDDMHELLQKMRKHAIRRVPVVEADGSLAGIITVDDVLDEIASDFSLIAGVLYKQGRVATRGLESSNG